MLITLEPESWVSVAAAVADTEQVPTLSAFSTPAFSEQIAVDKLTSVTGSKDGAVAVSDWVWPTVNGEIVLGVTTGTLAKSAAPPVTDATAENAEAGPRSTEFLAATVAL
jgi:hypothetical protein